MATPVEQFPDLSVKAHKNFLYLKTIAGHVCLPFRLRQFATNVEKREINHALFFTWLQLHLAARYLCASKIPWATVDPTPEPPAFYEYIARPPVTGRIPFQLTLKPRHSAALVSHTTLLTRRPPVAADTEFFPIDPFRTTTCRVAQPQRNPSGTASRPRSCVCGCCRLGKGACTARSVRPWPPSRA